ncbi:non-ribosomal peptide synthetase [Streptomyces iconiensis]|uniref:Phenyloxazoline synthase MbtB n=1 Tax=Streptomyces iconiensis TaxID=1384038 RepID=A0ABT6ZXA9_9ACTN|nr:amino acid adenylation domain-containing protein [Streptomyces iconiensis]MDJ1133696.1 amino acid adenylation domain-containing protein [Streptomyces iconiensis]
MTTHDLSPTRPASAPGEAEFPLTDLQAAYLVGSSPLMELGGFRPNLYTEIDLVDFDPEAARHAIDLLIARHEHLRTVMTEEGVQRVLTPPEVTPFRLRVVDLTGLPAPEQEEAIGRTRERMRDGGPEPTGWPLFEVTAHRLRRHRTRVHFAMSLLLLDSTSTRRLQEEWWELYRDPTAGLPPVGRTFRECVVARAAEEDTEDHRKQWRYWEDRLDSLPLAPRLPLARPSGGIESATLTRRTCVLSAEQWQRLRANFRAHRVLPTTGLLHVYAEVLGSWATAPHFCLNVLHQNWVVRHPEAEGVVGQFSATLPLEVDLRQDDDFFARAARLQRRLWKDLAHSDVSAVRVTRELAARRGWTSRAALPYVFNSMLGPGTRKTGGRGVCRTVHSALRTPQVLIDQQVKDAPGGGIECVWDTVDEAFPEGLPDAMFAAYRSLLESLAAPGGDRTRPAHPAPAHRDLVEALNRPAGPAPTGRLEDGFLAAAARWPERPAVVTADRTVTYGELERVSRSVAVWLRDHGVGGGDVVPVLMDKGWEQVAAVLGVLRAGAAYCPVSVTLPAERVTRLIGAGSARVVLCQSHRMPAPELLGALPVLSVDRTRPTDEAPEPPANGPGELAYIMYTSGSTGSPKGVMIEHAAALNTVLDINRRVRLGPDDRVFGISSLSFDLSVWDVFGTLGTGAALVLPAACEHPDPEMWADTAFALGATVWNSVPALAEMLVEVLAQRGSGVPPVRVFLLSGDWIPLSLPDRLRALRSEVRVLALGGATEASIWSNFFEVGTVDPGWRSIPYGKPLDGQTMRVLDHTMEVRPAWATGRVYIGGAGVARGYAHDPGRTDERFLRHPRTGERLYWTGDLGRYWPDGTIEFLGREDRQVQIQGFRVEPGEVEAAVRSHPSVEECVVCTAASPDGRARLVALVVGRAGSEVGAGEVERHLRELLPSYMVPGRLRVAERLPVTSNGKVDLDRVREMLAEPAGEPSGEDRADDKTARRLGELWAELLGVDSVGPDSDFFSLGGNSLLALRLVNRTRSELGAEVEFGRIFESPTLSAFAAAVQDGTRAAACAVTLSTGPAEGAGPGLFLFHPVGGSVTSYLELARAWPGPVHAFQSRMLVQGGEAPGEADLVAMAASYRQELLELSPVGPYMLGGWSMGGVLAYEVARQLAAEGHTCRVFMIDSLVAENRAPLTPQEGYVEFLGDLAGGLPPAELVTAVRAAEADGLAAVARASAVGHGLLPSEIGLVEFERLSRTHTHNLRLLGGYRPGPSEVPALLFAAGTGRDGTGEGWRAVCPAIEVEVRAGDHYSIVSADGLRAIAERVVRWLAVTGENRRSVVDGE